jgi:hypothetical protein
MLLTEVVSERLRGSSRMLFVSAEVLLDGDESHEPNMVWTGGV